MDLVDDRLVQLAPWRPIASPVERVVYDDRLRNVGRAIAVVAHHIVAADRVRKHGIVPLDVPVDRLRVWIDEQLRGIAPLPVRGIPRSVHTVPVALPGLDAR